MVIHRAVIDDREPDVMVKFMEEAGFAVYKERLAEGDYIIDGKLLFTLKDVNSDYMRSLATGHLHNEIESLIKVGADRFIALIVWGTARNGTDMSSAYESMETINAFYLPVFTAQDREGAVAVMVKWTMKTEQRKYSKFPLQVKRKVEAKSPKDIPPTVKMYRVGFGIGDDVAEALAERYPSMAHLIAGIVKNPTEWHKDIIRTDSKRAYIEAVLKTQRTLHQDTDGPLAGWPADVRPINFFKNSLSDSSALVYSMRTSINSATMTPAQEIDMDIREESHVGDID